mgnify:CR=1 FL=1
MIAASDLVMTFELLIYSLNNYTNTYYECIKLKN